MTAKEYLRSVKIAKARIQRLNQVRDGIINAMRMISSPQLGDRVQTSPRDRMPELMAELDSNETQLILAIENETKLIIKISQQIDNMNASETEKQCLHMRYVLCMDWNSLFLAMGYSESACHKFHRSALRRFQEQYISKRLQ